MAENVFESPTVTVAAELELVIVPRFCPTRPPAATPNCDAPPLCGPDLPAETVRRLAEAIADCRGGRPALQRRLRAIVRNELRSRGQSQFHFADQLFQAAHELGFGDLARFLRSAALAFRG